jgi:hypothetical protein
MDRYLKQDTIGNSSLPKSATVSITPGQVKSEAHANPRLSPDEQPKALAAAFAAAAPVKTDNAWKDFTVLHEFGDIEVQEEDGTWRPIEMSRHNT